MTFSYFQLTELESDWQVNAMVMLNEVIFDVIQPGIDCSGDMEMLSQ